MGCSAKGLKKEAEKQGLTDLVKLIEEKGD
jgi:hypothetical protein